MQAVVEAYDRKLAEQRPPMLLLTFEPGAIVQQAEIDWVRQNWPHCTIQSMGEGIHFVQEDQPRAIGTAIAQWLAERA